MQSTLLSPSSLHSSRHNQQPYASDTSSGYFGLAIASNHDPVSSSGARPVNRAASASSPNMSIRSAAASPPQSFTVNTNPEYEAFRRGSEARATFTLNQGGLSQYGITPRFVEPRKKPSPSALSSSSSSSSSSSTSRFSPPSITEEARLDEGNSARSDPYTKPSSLYLAKVDAATSGDASAVLSRSPKRLLSHDLSPTERPSRRESPASFHARDRCISSATGSPPRRSESENQRLSPPRRRANGASAGPVHNRGATLPATLESCEGPSMATPERIANIIEAHADETLVLDLRVANQYANSHIHGALNLCIPTTLLKRPAYDINKLAETFKDESQKKRFDRWQDCHSIILYDAASSKAKEATSCLNIFKKFDIQGWKGNCYIVQGGFTLFSRKFPKLVETADASVQSLLLSSDRGSDSDESGVAPVIGGCPMPATTAPANPFFGNIRQNMDLIGGVGQIAVHYPTNVENLDGYKIPAWLKMASDEKDKGKAISERFEQIERREQKRMQDALSGRVIYNDSEKASTAIPAGSSVQLAGIEKGSKNRYNNIWPYEHSRVKLKAFPSNGCDYVNANFVGATLSNKRYIATQGPIPSTFDDFWEMVWERDVRVIVMLTAETEGSQIKAHNYWKERNYGHLKLKFLSEHRASLEPSKIKRHRERPSLSDRRAFTAPGNVLNRTAGVRSSSGPNPPLLRVDESKAIDEAEHTASSTEHPFVVVRKFTIAHDAHPFERIREITQLQYSNWPDFGAPAEPAHLLGLVEQCDAVVKAAQTGRTFSADGPDAPDQRPVLVHCSAGCGRTGTFCTVDSVIDMLKRQQRSTNAQSARYTSPMDLDDTGSNKTGCVGDSAWLKGEDVDLIGKTVEEFRHQRLSMVQSLRQFVLCYETILEWAISQGPVKAPVSSLGC